jgi:hypothetical protein
MKKRSKIIYTAMNNFNSSTPGSNMTNVNQKTGTSFFSPKEILLNEKLLISLMLSGVALVLTTWAFRGQASKKEQVAYSN